MRRNLHLTITIILLFVSTVNYAQFWTEKSYFNGTDKSAQQVISYDGKLIAFFYAPGYIATFGISDNGGSSFSETELPAGAPLTGWKITVNGILFNTKINSNDILFNDILIADLKESNISFTVFGKADYDPESVLSAFIPNAKTSAPNGDIWLYNLKSTDNGTTWVNTGAIFGPTHIANNGDLLNVGSFGKISVSTDNAQTWTYIVENGNWKQPNDLVFFGESSMLVFSSDFPDISTDEGAS